MTELLFLGDSHMNCLAKPITEGRLRGYDCRIVQVPGATAVGLRHPKSKTQALQRFRDVLLPFRPDCIPVFQIGEVDCGFVIWVRAQRHGESVQQQLDASLAAYLNFLSEMQSAGYCRQIVTSATLPTIDDNPATMGEVHILRQEVQATQRERTDLTLTYNYRLQQGCRARGIDFLDIAELMLDPQTRLIRDDLKNPNLGDHHIHPDRGADLWISSLLRFLNMRP
ncbi:SGNH/GDSL hydrolase family protein [Sphingobium yanoikuyae]|uniref:SGNH/GDSL hydrolase family protein n=1 Tax=Sphingobium yanoikuyae TaxID=13690 RepID=UPI0022DD8DA7|nr:SGNH/GDSL hydrolase family protein [Sphingobium yanoikuyae]WBQ16845.1 SGNH/GDSL hydrolase family protein [Sphingobium yanoikuyae]